MSTLGMASYQGLALMHPCTQQIIQAASRAVPLFSHVGDAWRAIVDPPFVFVSTEELRSRLSLEINRASFGRQTVIVMRRGQKIAGIVSFDDALFLHKMKKARWEALSEKPPARNEEMRAYEERMGKARDLFL